MTTGSPPSTSTTPHAGQKGVVLDTTQLLIYGGLFLYPFLLTYMVIGVIRLVNDLGKDDK